MLAGIHLVRTKSGTYIRSNRNTSKKDNLSNLSVSIKEFFGDIKTSAQNVKISIINQYEKAYGKFLEVRFSHDELLYIENIARITKRDVIQRLQPLKKKIRDAAEKYAIDAELLGAVLIDELARSGPDDLMDVLGKWDIHDTSVGLAQVKLSTARDLIEKKYYPADPNISQSALYKLLQNDEVSVEFAAAYLSFIKKYRTQKGIGTSAAELATSYSSGLRDEPSSRGKEVANSLQKFVRDHLK